MWSAGEKIWDAEDGSGSGEFVISAHRVALRVSVALYVDGHLQVDRSTHLWENGLTILMRRPLAIGTRIEVEFFLPGGFDVHCEAVVRRHDEAPLRAGPSRPVAVDLELLEVDAWARTAIQDHVAARLP